MITIKDLDLISYELSYFADFKLISETIFIVGVSLVLLVYFIRLVYYFVSSI